MAPVRPAPLDPDGLYAEFPFLPGAEALVEGFGTSVGGLLTDPLYDRARELGRLRIRAAVEDPTAAPGYAELSRSSPPERYLSFQYARLLVSTLPARGALRRWAVAEAKGASARIRPGPHGALAEVARRLGYNFEEVSGEVRLPILDYLRLSISLREAEFRLIAQPVRDGWVRVPPERATRLLQEGIRAALARPLPLEEPVRAAIRAQESGFLEEVALRAPNPTARPNAGGGPMRPDLFPPCIRHMRRVLQEGENLSHAGRFALAAFLHRAGADTETIVDAYRGAPDFEESVTRYQVDHITRRNGGIGYEVPVCASIRSHGLCFRDGDPGAPLPGDREKDPMCARPPLQHPMQYYRWRGGAPAEVPKDPDAGAPASSA
jgi:DNA primase large subunit